MRRAPENKIDIRSRQPILDGGTLHNAVQSSAGKEPDVFRRSVPHRIEAHTAELHELGLNGLSRCSRPRWNRTGPGSAERLGH